MQTPDRPIEIPLDQLGGTIIVDCPSFRSEPNAIMPRLVHAGASGWLHGIQRSQFERSDREGYVRIRVPMVERGHYTVCLASFAEIPALRAGQLAPERCASGFLPPLGELKLTLVATQRD